ncbi:flagellar basal body-associated FliL family protein [Sphingomicrobium astaxanthinifaciens]|uniref:flagellar basal body-associated FliL family protein n=1 Tax=Sphingomicrobium astaxanthinifaciens TaxID=1227949 RepID=UPI001FCC6B6E|nr:flagellar basal body-associated FliL family protein [Sphingomicrobium astaxanthinifaciens]MCJ7420361.1 flagellar basal body-associated FliL family protein [Sphingomicrobium astaxanthinifaciens]
MGKENETDKPVKKGGLIGKVVLGLVLVSLGGGGALALVATGTIDSVEAKETGPAQILKGETDPYALPAGKDEVTIVYGDGGSEYRRAYFDFGEVFTTNLKNSDSLVQVKLAASTTYDGRVLMWLQEHQIALRSRILVELAATPATDIHSIAGKKELQGRLTAAINDELETLEGFGGVDDVHFQSLIVQ